MTKADISEQLKWGHVKFLGKLYIDRHKGKPLDEKLLQRAITIIRNQAPVKNKVRMIFTASEKSFSPTTGEPITPCLVGSDHNGDIVLKTAILNILSLGRIGSIVYYVTSGLETDTHSRFWVRAFSCRSKEHAQFLCSHVMTVCEIVQPGWTPKRGTQLSLLSLASRGSGYSMESGQSITSGLSAGQDGAPSMPAKSASQHQMRVQKPQPQPQPQPQARVPFGDVANAPESRTRRTTKAGQGSVQMRPKPSMAAMGRQPSLNLDDYITVEEV
jgi:hypothetical protein